MMHTQLVATRIRWGIFMNQTAKTEKAKITFTRMLADLLRDYAKLQADCRTFVAILGNSEKFEAVPTGWADSLSQMRETPEYQSISQQYDEVILRFEETADVHEVLQVLENMPKARDVH